MSRSVFVECQERERESEENVCCANTMKVSCGTINDKGKAELLN